MAQSILGRVTPDQIIEEPFPHLHVKEALDPDYYEKLAAAYPSPAHIIGERPLKNNAAYLMSVREAIEAGPLPEIWRDFFAYHASEAFFREAVELFRPHLASAYPDLEQRFGKPLSEVSVELRHRGQTKAPANFDADVMMDCQFGVNSPVSDPTSVRGAHVDKPVKLVAALLYMRLPDDFSGGGELVLYRPKGEQLWFDARIDAYERCVEPVCAIPYAANTLVMWINGPRSLHGVSPRSVTDVPRRYVNILAESYRAKGFFAIPRTRTNRATTRVRRLLGLRDA